MTHSHIKFTVRNEMGEEVELIEHKSRVTVIHNKKRGTTKIVIDHEGKGTEWTPLEPYSYFLNDLTGQSVVKPLQDPLATLKDRLAREQRAANPSASPAGPQGKAPEYPD